MRRLVAGALAITCSLAVLVLGGWFIGRGGAIGIPLLILGLLAFVVSVASSFPQATEFARDE